MDIVFEGVSFNADYYRAEIAKGMSENDFVKEGLRHGHYDRYDSTARENLLREAFHLIKQGAG